MIFGVHGEENNMKFTEATKEYLEEEKLNEGSSMYTLSTILKPMIKQLEDLKLAVRGKNGSDDPSLKKSSEITKPAAEAIKAFKAIVKSRGDEKAWFREYYGE